MLSGSCMNPRTAGVSAALGFTLLQGILLTDDVLITCRQCQRPPLECVRCLRPSLQSQGRAPPHTPTLAPVRCQRPPLASVRCLRPSLQFQGTTTHTHTRSCQVSAPHARRRRMSLCGNGSHPRPDAKSLHAADSCRHWHLSSFLQGRTGACKGATARSPPQ